MNLFRTKKSKKAISGVARASKDRVKLDLPWPHGFAQNVFVNYSDREFGLIQLVRGMMYILSNVETVFSKDRQLHLLNLLYLAEKFPIVEIKAYHAEVLRSIECGMKSWNDFFADDKHRILVTPNTNIKRDNRYLVCGTYQYGSCPISGDHFGKFGDKQLYHSCRKCARKGNTPYGSTCRNRVQLWIITTIFITQLIL
jgi:hypothetical protein